MNAQEILNRLSDIRVSGGNEADTRFQVIDQIIRQVLGWEDIDLKFEMRISEDGQDQFADYLLKTAQTSLLSKRRLAPTFPQLM
jgi:hypothetical protein